MVGQKVSKKVKVFSHFDEDHESYDQQISALLSPLKKDHTNLYKIGCMLNNSIRIKVALNSLISDSISETEKELTYNCFILPEMNTSLSVGFTLLGTFIITFFILYKFSPFGHWIHNCLRKKRKTIQNIVPEDSYKLINESSYMGKSHTESGKIRISYGSV
ncbi:PIR protein [Plasmodium brasilianum]|uniref:PIR protein n=1 Tax=Plasmodium brasilianum TaxID=5824 RepID=A0ACB9YEF7_PLABR|nr:PIR protein [Plasmodium brasilianum]